MAVAVALSAEGSLGVQKSTADPKRFQRKRTQ